MGSLPENKKKASARRSKQNAMRSAVDARAGGRFF